MILNQYESAFAKGEHALEEACSYNNNLLLLLHEKCIQLVDNQVFFTEMQTNPNDITLPDSPDIVAVPFTQAVKDVFESAYGAEPYGNSIEEF